MPVSKSKRKKQNGQRQSRAGRFALSSSASQGQGMAMRLLAYGALFVMLLIPAASTVSDPAQRMVHNTVQTYAGNVEGFVSDAVMNVRAALLRHTATKP